ncbi:glycosyltransferase [Komagataeibacter sp. FNDCR1]|nr:glycosyltransferase [Komagataeibacter sp. FNDCR1]
MSRDDVATPPSPGNEASGDETAGGDAHAALRHAQSLIARGEDAAARPWLDRAWRLAPQDAGIGFALAVGRMGMGDHAGVVRLLHPMLRQHDFREGWTLLALAHIALTQWEEARTAVSHVLSRHGFDTAIGECATRTCSALGLPGWVGMAGDGTLHWGGLPDGAAPVLHGGKHAPDLRRGRRSPTSCLLPPRARRAATMEATDRQGRALLGSPLHPAVIRRTVGAVRLDRGGISGWVWHPADPAHAPRITLRDGEGRVLMPPFDATRDAVPCPGLPPLARPRAVRIARTALPASGSVHVQTSDGRDMAGSPILLGPLPAPQRAGTTKAGARCRHIPRHGGRVHVIIPVHGSRDLTLACLDSVLHAPPQPASGIVMSVIVVDDATPDALLRADLDRMAATGAITLLRHAANRGYPHAINTGLAQAGGTDVVLLNSDTLVAPGWLDELAIVAYGHAETGTVTPFSNDASILTWPDPQADGHTAPPPDARQVRMLMEAARTANAGRAVDIPTGHGFCMFIRHDCLNATGPLRTDLFAHGYGEENDFCMRATRLGWRHVAAPGAFVGHVGGASFGVARQTLMQRNLWLINRLYPGYDALIRDHVARDPLAPARRRMGVVLWRRMSRAQGFSRAVVLATHAMSGGVDRVITDRARMWRARGLRPLILRPVADATRDTVGFRIAEDSDGTQGLKMPVLEFRWPAERDALLAFLRTEGVRTVEWHHALGHGARLRELCAALGVPYEMYVHDYAGLCPRLVMVGPSGRYCGEPDIAGCTRCIATLGSLLDPEEDGGIIALRERFGGDMARARRVIVPSHDVARRLARYFPAQPVQVRPPEDDRPTLSLPMLVAATPLPPDMQVVAPRPRTQRVRVLVVGAIGMEKGYDILRDAARDARAHGLPVEYVIAGYSANDAELLATGHVFITGRYDRAEALALVRAQQADVGFVPSVCPETWCFTLGLLWRAGLAAVAFDIGAVAERLRATGRGVTLPLSMGVHQLNMFFMSYATHTPPP